MPTDQYKLDGDELYERCDNDCCPINGGVGFGKSIGCWGAGCWNGTDAGAVCPHDPQPNQAGSLVNFRFPSCPSNVTNTLPQPECKISADMKQIGYAAAQSSGIKSSGELSREDVASITRNYLQYMGQALLDVGLPVHKLYNHAGGKPPRYRCHLGCILAIWVAFFSRWQRYRC